MGRDDSCRLCYYLKNVVFVTLFFPFLLSGCILNLKNIFSKMKDVHLVENTNLRDENSWRLLLSTFNSTY